MAAGNERGRPGGCPRRLPLVLFDLGVIHGRWCFAALEMCLGVFLGERRVGRQDDVDRAFLIERATVEPDGLGRLAVRHVQDQVGIEECPRGKRDLVSACRLFLRNQDNLDARSRKLELSSCFLFVRAMARGLSLNAKARRTLELHRERQTGGGRRSAADGGRQTRITQLAREGSPLPGLRLPQRSCHANPIRWLADGFPGSNPTCPASQSGLCGLRRSRCQIPISSLGRSAGCRSAAPRTARGSSGFPGLCRTCVPLEGHRDLLLISVAGCRSWAQRDLGRPQKVPTAIRDDGGT